MKPSQATSEQLEALHDFLSIFEWLVEHSHATSDAYYSRYRAPNSGTNNWDDQKSRTGFAAGRAAAAYERFGLVANPHPVVAWPLALSDADAVDHRSITAAIQSAIGAAESQLAAERARERGLTGLLASFIRWPQSLRDAVGGSKRQQRAASALGIGGQIIAGLAVAGILWLVGWGASQLFG